MSSTPQKRQQGVARGGAQLLFSTFVGTQQLHFSSDLRRLLKA